MMEVSGDTGGSDDDKDSGEDAKSDEKDEAEAKSDDKEAKSEEKKPAPKKSGGSRKETVKVPALDGFRQCAGDRDQRQRR